MNSIPASQLVNVVPSVLGAGGNPLSFNSVFLTLDASIPIGTVQPFATLADVQAWFGADSTEATLAAVYFNGFAGSSTTPGLLYFVQYNSADVAGYLRGGSLKGMTLAQLQALSGTLIVTVDGEIVTSASINLASATSFSNAATLMQAGLRTAGGIFSGTGSITATTLTISAVASGVLHVGDTIVGGPAANTTIVAQLSGTTGGVGTYTVSVSQSYGSGPVKVTSAASVSYDALRHGFVITSPTTGDGSTVGFSSGTLATGVKLTSATGAVLSGGADAATPAGTMADVVDATQNWVSFMTTWEPLTAVKLQFAAWVQTVGQRYFYVGWDSDVTPLAGAAPDSFGAIIKAADDNGVFVIYDPDGKKGAFVCGTTASINFTQRNGRITYAYKWQAGLVPDITNATQANSLLSNGYNFYGQYATANDQFRNLQNGAIAGAWGWLDAFVNQVWLNNELQLAYMAFFESVKSVPYNAEGYSALRAVALDPINAALLFGAIRPGVPLSASQRAQVNTAAGVNIADVLEQVGYYLQILPASAETRALRASPPMTLWYMDGGSIQKINLASISIQ